MALGVAATGGQERVRGPHGIGRRLASGSCSHKAELLQKAERLLSSQIHTDVLNTVARIPAVVNKATLLDAARAGTVFTPADFGELARCANGVLRHPLEERMLTAGGDHVHQGDMVVLLGSTAKASVGKPGNMSPVVGFGGTWSDGQVRFCYADSLGGEAREAWKLAVAGVQRQVPCLRFKEVEAKGSEGCAEIPSIIVMSDQEGCWSHVGQVSDIAALEGKSQPLNLGVGCGFTGMAAHQLGHALGLLHQQARSDRDKFVSVHDGHVQDGMLDQFAVDDQVPTSTPYDIFSLMHYSSTAFSQDGKATVTPHNSTFTPFVGQRMGFTQSDVQQLGEMYGCKGSVSPDVRTGELRKLLAEAGAGARATSRASAEGADKSKGGAAPGAEFVVLALTVEGVDYEVLEAYPKVWAAFEDHARRAIAGEIGHGVDLHDVDVFLAQAMPGSLLVRASIHVRKGGDAINGTMARLQQWYMSRSLEASLSAVDGMQGLQLGGLHISHLKVNGEPVTAEAADKLVHQTKTSNWHDSVEAPSTADKEPHADEEAPGTADEEPHLDKEAPSTADKEPHADKEEASSPSAAPSPSPPPWTTQGPISYEEWTMAERRELDPEGVKEAAKKSKYNPFGPEPVQRQAPKAADELPQAQPEAAEGSPRAQPKAQQEARQDDSVLSAIKSRLGSNAIPLLGCGLVVLITAAGLCTTAASRSCRSPNFDASWEPLDSATERLPEDPQGDRICNGDRHCAVLPCVVQ